MKYYIKSICLFLIILAFSANIIKVNAAVRPSTFYHAIFGTGEPDLTGVKRLRFLTTDDFYPFNYRPKQGAPLAGYNVDLMRAICKQLNVLPKCQLEPVPYDKLVDNLEKGEGDAIMAGLGPRTPGLPSNLSFSRPYMLFPARFLCCTDSIKDGKFAKGLPISKQHIGVLKDTKHLEMLKLYFPNIKYTTYASLTDLTTALQKGKIDAIFGDGRTLASLQGNYSFEGEPYYNEKFLGTGMQAVVLAKRSEILDAINYAIEKLAKSGELYMIYLRHFPRNFY